MKSLKYAWHTLMDDIIRNGKLINDDDPYLELTNKSIEFDPVAAFSLLEDGRINSDFAEMEKVFFTDQSNRFGHNYLDCAITLQKSGRLPTDDIARILRNNSYTRKAVITYTPYASDRIPCIRAY